MAGLCPLTWKTFRSVFIIAFLYLLPTAAWGASFVYDNTTPAALDELAAPCDSGELERNFMVMDAFTIEAVQLGFNADHTYRGDIQLTLRSPAGTEVRVIASDGGDGRDNYDVRLDDAATGILHDQSSDATAPPYFERAAQPSQPLAAFQGESAQGVWTLAMCDRFDQDGGTYNRSRLIFAGIPVASCSATEIGGVVYRDDDGSGSQDAWESGVAGITVTAYDVANGAVATAMTDAAGRYQLSGLSAGASYRLELTDMPAGQWPTTLGDGSGTTVQFAAAGHCGASLGLVDPGAFCAGDPDLAANCYLAGEQSGQDGDVLITFPYGAGAVGASLPPAVDEPAAAHLAAAWQMGTTWGLAYQRETDSLFATAFMKRHSGFGPGGPAALYRIDRQTAAVELFLDLDDLFGPGSAGNDPRSAGTDFLIDAAAWDAVGKVGFGDLDISADGTTLWTLNLADRRLYEIPIGIPATPPSAAAIGRHDLPVPSDCPDATTNLRPFATAVHRNAVYVGMVCSAETTQNPADLKAYVYAFEAGTWSRVLDAPLDYPRGCVVVPGCDSAAWNPWAPTFTANPSGDFAGEHFYPQPWLTDIAFDGEDMILGLRDRFGDQTGYRLPSTDPLDSTLYTGDAAGDLLRACRDASGFHLENNGGCGGIVTAGTGGGQGPGGGEYYFAESYPLHDETALGGLAQVPGRAEIVVTAYDPIFDPNEAFDGGILWLRNRDGARARAYRLYDTDGGSAGTFAKGGGLGDLEALCAPAPLEIGDRVWHDVDGDGVQTPGETGLGGVTVTLRCADVSATTVTDASGRYRFTDDLFALQTGRAIPRFSACTLAIDTAQAALAATPIATAANHGGSDPAADLRDADGLPLSDGRVGVALTTGGSGASDHSFDFGFVAAAVLPAALSGRVWEDFDSDGIEDAGEVGLAEIVVELLDASGATIASTTTAADGTYGFEDLPPGDYAVVFLPPLGFALSPQNMGVDDRVDSDADPVSGETPYLVLAAGAKAEDVDAGVVPPPTAAVVTTFAAWADRGRLVLRWETRSEVATAGFYLYRYEAAQTGYVPVHETLLPGLLDAPAGGTYHLVDESASLAGTYTYVLVEVESSGTQRFHGPYTVTAMAEVAQALPDDVISTRDAHPVPAHERARRATAAAERRAAATARGLRQGKALQIAVEADGLYYLGVAAIAAPLGLEASRVARLIDDGNLALSHRGAPVAWLPAADNSGLYFYGRAIDSPYTWRNIYWLRRGPGLLMDTVAGGSPAPVAGTPTFRATLEREEDRLPAPGIFTNPDAVDSEADYWFWDKVSSGHPSQGRKRFPFRAAGAADDAMSAELTLRLHGATASGNSDEHRAIIRLNGQPIGETTWQGLAPHSTTFTFDPGLLAAATGVKNGEGDDILLDESGEGDDIIDGLWAGSFKNGEGDDILLDESGEGDDILLDESGEGDDIIDGLWAGSFKNGEGDDILEVEGVVANGVPYSLFYVDGFTLRYARRYAMEDGVLLFHADGRRAVTLSGLATPTVWIFEISDPQRPQAVEGVTLSGTAGDYQASFAPVSSADRYLAVTPAAVATPVAIWADAPSDLRTSAAGADYLVIAPEALAAGAEALADLRRDGGLDARVVLLEDIMDEFNHGIASPHALRAFLAHAYRNWDPAPRYVVLAGAGSYDYRDLLDHGDSLVPPLMVLTSAGLFAADTPFADVVGEDGIPELAVGRLPVLTTEELMAVVAKLSARQAARETAGTSFGTTFGWQHRALMLADNPDAGGDFGVASRRLASRLPAGYTAAMIDLETQPLATARHELFTALATGVGLVSYIGHGGLDRLADEGLLVSSDIPSLAQGGQTPILTGLTCVINRFGVPGFAALGAQLVTAADGGAAAVWAASGLSMHREALVLAAGFSAHGPGRGGRLGDAIVAAHSELARRGGSQTTLSIYTLLGDPAVVLD